MSFKEEVLELLIASAVDKMGADRATLSAETRFKTDLGCKSADIVRFTAVLEDEYEVEVPFMAFNRCATFGDAADYICKLMGMM